MRASGAWCTETVRGDGARDLGDHRRRSTQTFNPSKQHRSKQLFSGFLGAARGVGLDVEKGAGGGAREGGGKGRQ